MIVPSKAGDLFEISLVCMPDLLKPGVQLCCNLLFVYFYSLRLLLVGIVMRMRMDKHFYSKLK